MLPYHKLLDRAHEASQQIGTTGRGIGPAYEAKTGRRGLRVADLRDLARAGAILAEGVARANQTMQFLGGTEHASLDEHVALLERLAPRLLPLAKDTGKIVFRALKEGKRVLLEGAQGALLDVDHGTYPFVTSSSTTAGGACTGAGIGPTYIDGVLGVVKAYTTRVGNGPLPTEAEPPDEAKLRKLGHEFGATTGRPRRCGWFDAMVVRYSVRVNGLTGLAVTKLDVLDTFAEIPVGVRYLNADGTPCDVMPADVESLAEGHHQGPEARRPAAGRARIPRSVAGPLRGADPLRQRGDASGSDHRGVTRADRRVATSMRNLPERREGPTQR